MLSGFTDLSILERHDHPGETHFHKVLEILQQPPPKLVLVKNTSDSDTVHNEVHSPDTNPTAW